MHEVSREDIQAMLQQLEQAIHNHQRWYESLVRTLVCRLVPDPANLAPDAHRRCAFGQWYYQRAPEKLRSHPGFQLLEAEHAQMHRTAAELLRDTQAGVQVSGEHYDRFAEALARLHRQLGNLMRELENALGELDPLTGAHGRRSMHAWLREQQQLVRRGVLSCGVAMIDLDHFKAINDRYGHAAGDHVLTRVAHFLIGRIRPYDRLYRYGGEEFLLCTPDTDLPACHTLVDRLRQGLSERPIEYRGSPIACRVSCGVTLLDPAAPVEASIENADIALYAAKSAGRDRCCIWHPSLS